MEDQDCPKLTTPENCIRCRSQIEALLQHANLGEEERAVVMGIRDKLETEGRLSVRDTLVLQRFGIEYL